jgi:hypothetical protein
MHMTCHEENKIESHHLEIVEITTFHITKIDFLKRYAKAWTFKKNGSMVSETLQILSCFCQKCFTNFHNSNGFYEA